MKHNQTKFTFTERGGWWVAAQLPVLLIALLLPVSSDYAEGGFVHPVQFVGLTIAIAGLALVALALVTLGDALTPFPRPRTRARLRTHGVYAALRHPVYAGLIVAGFGWALAWMSPLGLLWTLAVAAFLDRKAAREERWLRERFSEYGDYARRVRKFIPGVY